MDGMMQDTSIAGSTPTVYHGRFFAIINANYQSLLATIDSGGTVTAPGVIANFNPLPEPESAKLMFGPLLLFGGVLARRALVSRKRA
jgi:hypothetical protein